MKIKKQHKSTKVGFHFDITKCLFFEKCKMVSVWCLLVFILYSSASVYANPNQAAVKKISLKLNLVTMSEAISELQNKTGYVINYDQKIFNPVQKINLELKEVNVQEALKKLLTSNHVGFKNVDENTIVLYKLPDPIKPGRISGKILDDKGQALSGANIKIIETGSRVQTGPDGNYMLKLMPGTYTLEISYISFATQKITGVLVSEEKTTVLDISLKPTTNKLKEVMVVSDYKKASIEGLLIKQKNAVEISNGISAEQIARTPDKNIGESLKRISGVSTVDNKFILIRGIGERYNTAMLDGVVLPSTEAQSRNFSFDLIPSNMVDYVVVSKTVSPDMNASFGGGLIQINTKDIPNENFMSFTAGVSYNDQSTGKDFLSHKRGKYDYFGFDDGRRKFPENLESTRRYSSDVEITNEQHWKKVIDQSLKFKNDNFTLHKYQAIPSQNYQFSIGRLLSTDTAKYKLGLTAALSYRNTQSVNNITHQSRGGWTSGIPSTGNVYDFNTTLGSLLNIGLQMGKNHRFSLRNTFTHVYDNALSQITGYHKDIPYTRNEPPTIIEESDDPTYTNLLQNKLSGQHQFGIVKIDWDVARASITRKEKDLSTLGYYGSFVSNEYVYIPSYGQSLAPSFEPTSRQNYNNQEIDYSWGLSATMPFNLPGIRSNIKTGYFGTQKKAKFDWFIVAFVSDSYEPIERSLTVLSIAEKQKPENIGKNGFFYAVNTNLFLDFFEGESKTHAGFLMLDNRFGTKFRLVWGIRGEYYKYTDINNGNNTSFELFKPKSDPRWKWLPSANFTYSPLSALNIRLAYSSSVVRPELMDNSAFWRYRPDLDAQFGNNGLYSTTIDSWDFKTEWFSGLGEIISAGIFYKKFDKPAELIMNDASGNTQYYLTSSDWAKVYGLEFELRKSLGFIANHKVLNNLHVYGNFTLQKSEVKTTYIVDNPELGGLPLELPSKFNRYMYGQSPYLINAGLQYSGARLGFNIMFNKSGYKTYIVSNNSDKIEYEKPRQQIDAQISYRFFRKRLELKVNAGNLLNEASTFYQNRDDYGVNRDDTGEGDGKQLTNKYEEGDMILFSQKFGRTFSTSLTYTF